MPETMAEVCWWRLMAEEVRTQAEDFSSASTKTTMLDVAATWDRMADNLERHLTISVRVSERECGRGLAQLRRFDPPFRDFRGASH